MMMLYVLIEWCQIKEFYFWLEFFKGQIMYKFIMALKVNYRIKVNFSGLAGQFLAKVDQIISTIQF